MADPAHLAILKQGVEAWNKWRADAGETQPHPDLREAKLDGIALSRVDLRGADFTRADLGEADLRGADLSGADLSGADLAYVDLAGANLGRANLDAANFTLGNVTGANFHDAFISGANFTMAELDGADLGQSMLLETLFIDVDLSRTKGLDACEQAGPSTLDHRTLHRSRNLPLNFLRGCGLPDRLIDYLPSLLNDPIQYYSCFISYSHKNEDFAQRLHADLQDKSVRCWFAPEDLKIGDKIWDSIDRAIRLRDKLLLILSEASIESDWVEDEVTKAFAEERTRKQLVLFPVRIDDAVKDTAKPWASKLRDSRHIGDFREWKNHDAYRTAFERLMRDLATGASG